MKSPDANLPFDFVHHVPIVKKMICLQEPQFLLLVYVGSNLCFIRFYGSLKSIHIPTALVQKRK